MKHSPEDTVYIYKQYPKAKTIVGMLRQPMKFSKEYLRMVAEEIKKHEKEKKQNAQRNRVGRA